MGRNSSSVGHVVYAERRVEPGELERLEREISPAGDFADKEEPLLAETLPEFVDRHVNQPRRARLHVLHRVHAKSVHVGERNPELVGLEDVHEGASGMEGADVFAAVLVEIVIPVIDVLERLEIAAQELRLVIPRRDLSFRRESRSCALNHCRIDFRN